MKNRVPVTCNLDCGAGCALSALVENGRVVRIENSPLRPSHATGCPVGFNFPKVVYAKARLSRPLLRTGPRGSGQFRELSWNAALDLTAGRLAEIREKHGEGSLIRLGGSGSCKGALHNTAGLTQRFLSFWGAYTETLGNYSSQATSFASPYVLGTRTAGLDVKTLDHSEMILLWGANIFDTRFGNETAKRIGQLKKSGVPVIVIDPRRSRTVKHLGTEWIRVFPGTDTALMAALLHVLITENRVDRDFLDKYSIGFEELERYILGKTDHTPKTPAWAEKVCGTPTETIVSLARRYADARPAALLPGLSIQRTVGGEEAARLGIVLQAATGNIGKRGGSSGANAFSRLPGPRCGEIGPVKKAGAGVQVYGYADAILGGRKGGYPSDIKAIYNVGGNFLSQGSDIAKNMAAFSKVDFSVCHDAFMTPTAKFCDIILPVTTWIEREDIVFADNNYLHYSHQAIEPVGGARNDYDIFCELADRLGFLAAFSEGRTPGQWLDHFLKDSDVTDPGKFRQTGIFNGKEHDRTAFADFIREPDRYPLDTPSGLIEISSEPYAQTGFSPYPTCRVLPPEKHYPLRLVSPHARFRIHSQTAGSSWSQERDRQVLWINTMDAEKREIEDGETVSVTSKAGRIDIEAFVTDEIMAGVVCLLEGAWPEIENGVDRAGSVNMLTSTEPTMPSHGSRTHSTLVEVTAVIQ